MKRAVTCLHRIKSSALFLLLLVPAALQCVEHDVTYTEGYPYLRSSYGEEVDLNIGDTVRSGDTVVTEVGDVVWLESEGYQVRISEETVFTVMEMEEDGKKSDVLTCVLGKLNFSRDKFLGTEPRLRTSNAVCGVRGTNVAVLAGVDGSSLFIVEDGRVEIEAGGQSIRLGTREGVEIETGSAPGEKFNVLEREIDFSVWNRDRLDALLEDPVNAALKVETQMLSFIAELEKIYPLYLETSEKLTTARETLTGIQKERGEADAKKYYKQTVFPLEQEITFRRVNLRYYALSILSLRRFIASRLYITLKVMYIMNTEDPVYRDFLRIHSRILATYEEQVINRDTEKPFIVLADI